MHCDMTADMTAFTLPRHSATTRHVSSAYLWQAGQGLPAKGPLLGYTRPGAAHHYDPWAFYPGIITNPNVLVAGDVGAGKSTAVKCYLHRQVGSFGRWAAIMDPKGEYQALAEALGLSVVRLAPGGSCRLNPLDAGPRPDPAQLARRRAEIVAHMAAASLQRRLNPEERAGIGAAINDVSASVDAPELGHVVDRLLSPTRAMVTEMRGTSVGDTATALREVALELCRLLAGDLAGMFDGPTTVRVDWTGGRGIVLDLSAVYHVQSREALALVMLCATSWLQSVLTAPGPRRIVVIEEAWAMLGDLNTARWLQASYKLSRAYGVSNMAVVHRLSDLASGGDDGSQQVKLAMGLLSDTGTRIIFRQPPDQIPTARSLLGLTEAEAELLPRLPRARALWKVGQHAALVDHARMPSEERLTDTDERMTA